MLDREQLETFATVAEQQSFERAAAVLHVTRGAVSQRIKALEESLATILLLRDKPVTPTPAGESLLRHVKALRLLEASSLRELSTGADHDGPVPLSIAVNADSLATWFVPALAAVAAAHPVRFDLVVDDQDHAHELLREGRVMAAVTAEPHPVQGCRVERLGELRYVAVASPAFVARHFPDGPTDAALATAPITVFDRKDRLQARFLRRLSRRVLAPPVHHVPSTHGFVHAALHGLGWGMHPAMLVAPLLAAGDLVEIAPGRDLRVPLHWQCWRLEAEVLRALNLAVEAAARAALT